MQLISDPEALVIIVCGLVFLDAPPLIQVGWLLYIAAFLTGRALHAAGGDEWGFPHGR